MACLDWCQLASIDFFLQREQFHSSNTFIVPQWEKAAQNGEIYLFGLKNHRLARDGQVDTELIN